LIDLITAPEDNVDLSKFSLEKCVESLFPNDQPTDCVLRHHLIVVYKTAFYSFYLPVALAMRMVRNLRDLIYTQPLLMMNFKAGVTDEAAYKEALDILLPLGEYFQVQDDYLDCYGDEKVIGKIGTDILVSAMLAVRSR
jgi:farnesyl diphosphate synthase